MAYGAILGQTPTASNVTYNNSQTSSIITGTNVQQAIDQLFTSVSNGKAQIASAITDKGVSTSASDTFAQMAANIGSIQTGQSYEETTEFSTFTSWWVDYTESDKFGVVVSVFNANTGETNPIFAGFSWLGTPNIGMFGSADISISIQNDINFSYVGLFSGSAFELYITNLENHDNMVHLFCDAGVIITEDNLHPDLFSFTFFAIR